MRLLHINFFSLLVLSSNHFNKSPGSLGSRAVACKTNVNITADM